MKIATIIVRILLGGMMLFASIAYFFELGGEQPTPTGDMATVMGGFVAMKYMFPLAKSIELICGLALVTGKFMRLALLVLLPITVNIFLIHLVVSQTDIPLVTGILLAHLFLIYANWDSYKHLFTA